MTEIIIVPELENNAWPPEFANAWGNIFVSDLGNTVLSLYFNNINPEGTIIEDSSYLELPDAYISISPRGDIYEIFVKKEFRRNKIGATMCAWTRTNFISRGIEVVAPLAMSDSAKYLYEYMSLEYNEPYNSPSIAPIFDIYKDFGGRSMFEIDIY